MIWLELRANLRKYKDGWNIKESVWAPIKKENSAKWFFWSLLNDVTQGDLVFHLSEFEGEKCFIGYSIAESDGYITHSTPTFDKHEWDFIDSYFKVDLKDFYPFSKPVKLSDFFKNHDSQIREIHVNMKSPKGLFCVIQREKLQCLNGAYFSRFDDLAHLLLQSLENTNISNRLSVPNTTETGEVTREIKQRIGQQKFSENVRNNFDGRCCFPECKISGQGFVVGSHIDRWSDNKELRGDTSNGLALCLLHDKAFEKGYFTLDSNYRVIINNKELPLWAEKLLFYAEGKEINSRKINPSLDALNSHWRRVGHSKRE